MKNKDIYSLNFGKLMILIGICMLIPVIDVIFYFEDIKYVVAFVVPATISILFGIVLDINIFRKFCYDNTFIRKFSSVMVLSIWIYAFFMGAIPFVLGKQLNFIQALFESVSGWTTTGLSVMDVRVVPKIFLFYRSFMQYCGGLGFVLIIVMLFQGKQAMSLFNAEGHSDQLVPNLKKTARTISLMYLIYLMIGTIVYYVVGMPFFDSLNHAMCALSTGGFSTQYDSIGAYRNIYIEAITILLMIIGTTNFAVLLLLSQRKFKRLFKVSEVRFFAVLILFSVPVVAGSLVSGMYISFGEGLRLAIFNIVSSLSTSGFSTMSYVGWPALSIGIMILFMIIGGGIGSTAGGMKLTRVYLISRIVKENIKKRLHTFRSVSNPYFYRAQGKTFIDHTLESDVVGFVFLYIIIFLLGTLSITITENCSFTEAMFEFASSLGTVGLSIGITGPTTNSFTLVIEMIGMFLGRLEIFIVIEGFYFIFKHIKIKFFNMYKKQNKNI